MTLAITSYEWFKTLHVLPAVLWVGTNFSFHVLAARMDFATDPKGAARLLRDSEWLGTRLLAWAYSFVAGVFYLGRNAIPFAEQLEAEGYSASVAERVKTFYLVARLEMAFLILVVLDMTLKPGG